VIKGYNNFNKGIVVVIFYFKKKERSHNLKNISKSREKNINAAGEDD